MTMTLREEALKLHMDNNGKIAVVSKVPIATRHDLAIAYTPGVAEPCKDIKEDKNLSFEYTCRGNMVAIITDGTRVLGLGDIGPEAAMPVMEGKAALFKTFGDVDAVPVCLDTKDPDEFIRRDGKEGFDKLPALTPQAYRMRRLRAEHDLTTQEGRTAYAKACAAILRNLEPVEMENALQELIVQTGFSRDVLIAQIGMTPPKDITSAPPLPARIARPPATPVPEPENADEDVRAEELLLSLIASSRLPEDLAQEDDFRDPLLKELFLQLQSGVSAASLVESQSDEVVRARVSHLLMAQSGESTDQMLQMAHDCLSRMRLKRARAQYDEIMKRIKTLSGAEKMQQLASEMERQGFSSAEIDKVFSLNALRVFQSVLS